MEIPTTQAKSKGIISDNIHLGYIISFWTFYTGS